VRRYNGPGNGDEYATALGVSPDGSTVFVTGYSPGSGTSYDYATLAFDASTGKTRWARRYNGPANGGDEAYALGMSPDGSTVFVTGASTGSGTSEDHATAAYDASTGKTRWVRRYNGPGNSLDAAYALGVGPDGSTVFITGYSLGSGTSDDYATLAYDGSTGATRWVRRYNGPANSEDDAYALGVSPDGSTLFVTGASFGSATYDDYATAAYDASSGATRWVRRYNGPGEQPGLCLRTGGEPRRVDRVRDRLQHRIGDLIRLRHGGLQRELSGLRFREVELNPDTALRRGPAQRSRSGETVTANLESAYAEPAARRGGGRQITASRTRPSLLAIFSTGR
jgi:hypothetical protein